MSQWRDQLRPASLDGVSFEVNSIDGTFGRRVVTHEYPLRDAPFIEDMGRATRKFTFSAFVIGDNYGPSRDALLSVIETAGKKTLIHPFLGSLDVAVESCTVRESKDEGGMARFTLTFLEFGEQLFPTSSGTSRSQLDVSADKANKAIKNDFIKTFSVKGQSSFVRTSAESAGVEALTAIQESLGG